MSVGRALCHPRSVCPICCTPHKKILVLLHVDHQENVCLWTKRVERSGQALSKMKLRELARLRLTQLMDETGLCCHSGIIDLDSGCCILKVKFSSTISVRSHEGNVSLRYR